MGKLIIRLKKQLKTDYKKDAEDCIKIYNKLSKMYDNHVWSSNWTPLVDVKFKGFPSDERTYKPSMIGIYFLKGLEKELTDY
jgi:hypothetical protein